MTTASTTASTTVRFALPAGYSLATYHRGFVFTHGGVTHFAAVGAVAPQPFATPGSAVRAIIKHAGLDGEARSALKRQIAALPEQHR